MRSPTNSSPSLFPALFMAWLPRPDDGMTYFILINVPSIYTQNLSIYVSVLRCRILPIAHRPFTIVENMQTLLRGRNCIDRNCRGPTKCLRRHDRWVRDIKHVLFGWSHAHTCAHTNILADTQYRFGRA